jgi:predicted dithiol-disulfide oxidoreductase (DUF899 family)
MATSKERDEEHGKGHLAMNTPEFDGPKGKVSLLDLFEGRRQLIVYRAFFEPGVFGWPEMPWYTITDGFDADFGVDEWHGHNVFLRDGERVFRTYFINGRGDEAMGTTWSYLDITPLGRQETWEDSAEGPPDPAVQVVELARQLRRRGLA